MTAEQRRRSKTQIQVDYDNIDIDEDGFLFAVSSSIDKTKQYNALLSDSTASDYAPVKRLNPSGDDVLKRTGFFPPAGDLLIDTSLSKEETVSAFVGVAAGELGTYSVIDSTNKRLFTYDADGNLLCAFGGEGAGMGEFSSVTAIAYQGTNLAVLDNFSEKVTVFELSEYGSMVLDAIRLTNNRQYDAALTKWEEILPMNSNLDIIYNDIGKAYLRSGNYDSAMYYFQLVGNIKYYSQAFQMKRTASLNSLLLIVPMVLAAFILLVSLAFKRMKQINQADNLNASLKVTTRKELLYGVYAMFHPFDGFYQIKRYKRGGWRGALIILGAATLSLLAYQYLSGPIFSKTVDSDTSLLKGVLQFIFPVIVFAIANYCVTSLMDGEGSLSNIVITVCYSLLPLILILPVCTVAANFISLEEGQILNFAVTAAYGWTVILVIFGLLTIHGYSLAKNIVSLLLSLLGVAVILFLVLLFLTLTQKMYVFFYNAVTELLYRL